MSAAVTTASIIAAQNAQREPEKKVHECSLYVEGFEHNKASVEQIQLYTECAELLYPKPSPEYGLFDKVCIVSLLLAFVAGLIYGAVKEQTVFDSILLAILTPLLVGFGWVVGFLIVGGIGIVIS